MQARLINPYLNKLQEDFVYTNPYITSPENRWNTLHESEGVSAKRMQQCFTILVAEEATAR